MDTPAVIPVTEVVKSYLNSKGTYTKINSRRYLQMLLEGFGDLNIFTSGSFKTYYPTIDSTNRISVPLEYIDYVRIGFPMLGEIWTLTKNDNLILPNAMDCGAEVGDSENMTPIDFANLNWVDYGATGGANFLYYRWDKENRKLVFQGDGVGRQVIVEYLSTGVSLSGDTMVPREMLSLLKTYLRWQELSYDDRTPMNKEEIARRNFYDAKNQYNNFKNSFTVNEFLDALYSTYRQTPKR